MSAGQFSTGSNFPPFGLELKYSGDARFSVFCASLSLARKDEPVDTSASPQFFYSSSSSGCHSLSSSSCLLPPQSFALLSGLSLAALNFFRPRPSSLPLHFVFIPIPSSFPTSRRVVRPPPDPTDRAIAPASLGVFAFNPLKGRVCNYYLRHRLKIPPRTRIRRVRCRLREHTRAPINH